MEIAEVFFLLLLFSPYVLKNLKILFNICSLFIIGMYVHTHAYMYVCIYLF